jgi:hypothetical protein
MEKKEEINVHTEKSGAFTRAKQATEEILKEVGENIQHTSHKIKEFIIKKEHGIEEFIKEAEHGIASKIWKSNSQQEQEMALEKGKKQFLLMIL